MSLLSWEEYKSGARVETIVPEYTLKPKVTPPEILPPEIAVPKLVDVDVKISEPIPIIDPSFMDKPSMQEVILNGISIEDLCVIKGIGPKTAEKIVSNLPFHDFDELSKVVSPTVFRRISEWVANKISEC